MAITCTLTPLGTSEDVFATIPASNSAIAQLIRGSGGRTKYLTIKPTRMAR
jgi:hypothetical protein